MEDGYLLRWDVGIL